MPIQHKNLEPEPEAASRFQSTLSHAPRDAFGRTLDQAQQEDNTWREGFIARAREKLLRLNRLEGGTGVAGVVISSSLLIVTCIAGTLMDPVRHRWISMEQMLNLFYGLSLGTVTICLLGIAGIRFWSRLQEIVLQNHRRIGIELDESYSASSAEIEVPVSHPHEFLDCRECGTSIPAQAPTCRRCGAKVFPPTPDAWAAWRSWLEQNPYTRSLARVLSAPQKWPLDIIVCVILAIVVISAMFARSF